MLAKNHLIASQYSPSWIRNVRALTYRIPVRPRQIMRTIAPRYHHRMVTGWPAKVRFGRAGTCVQETIHLQYMTRTHGNGMTRTAPTRKTSERQTNSEIPKSIESDPLPRPPALAGGPPE